MLDVYIDVPFGAGRGIGRVIPVQHLIVIRVTVSIRVFFIRVSANPSFVHVR